MSMTKCSDCKREISSSARACPLCGAPQTSVSKAVTIALVVIAAMLAYAFCAGGGSKGMDEMERTMGSGK
jgi:hypothetical protein